MGLNQTLNLPIIGEGIPKIPHPSDSDWDGLRLTMDGIWIWSQLNSVTDFSFL